MNSELLGLVHNSRSVGRAPKQKIDFVREQAIMLFVDKANMNKKEKINRKKRGGQKHRPSGDDRPREAPRGWDRPGQERSAGLDEKGIEIHESASNAVIANYHQKHCLAARECAGIGASRSMHYVFRAFRRSCIQEPDHSSSGRLNTSNSGRMQYPPRVWVAVLYICWVWYMCLPS